MTQPAPLLVIGTGPTGLMAALALAEGSADVALLGPRPAAPAARTAALFQPSLNLLANIGAWEACRAGSAPLKAIRLVDATGGLLRAPEALFEAADVGLDEFGWNVPNAVLVAALAKCAASHPRIRFVETPAVTQIAIAEKGVAARLADGTTVDGCVAIGADGRHSVCRSAAGITTTAWTYPQVALVALLAHGRPHRGISTELHRRAGPLTVVPMPGRQSSLVWVETPQEAARLAQISDDAFRAELEEHLQGLLGSIERVRDRAAFPLTGLTATRMAARRVALVGEAAHVFPPIGAQGLNLGIRDVAALADTIAAALAEGRDPGGPETLAAYDAARRADVGSRTLAVDLLDRSLIADLLPVDLLRGAALHAVNAIPALRGALIRQGLAPAGGLPRLMQAAGTRPLRPDNA